jgi:hypothetical protein
MFIAIENYSFQISPKFQGVLIAKIQFGRTCPRLRNSAQLKSRPASSDQTRKADFWHSPKASAKNMASRMNLSTCAAKI